MTAWYHSPNIVLVCFIGGAGGYALRYLLGLSPGTDVEAHLSQSVRDDGAAHALLDRNGLRLATDPKTILHLESWPVPSAWDFPHAVWADDIDPRLLDMVRETLAAAVDPSGRPMGDVVNERKLIMVDHLPPSYAKALFPNAVILYLKRDLLSCARDYIIKNMFQSPAADLGTFGHRQTVRTTLEARVLDHGWPLCRSSYKRQIATTVAWLAYIESKIGHHTDWIDADRLFSADDWQQEYTKVTDMCRLEPNYVSAEQFITAYASRQYDRNSKTQIESLLTGL